MNLTTKIILLTFGLLLFRLQSFAQCAMCRATIETNVSNGDTSIGAGLNLGILYLLIMPYVIAGVIGYFWYKNSKKRKSKFTFYGEKI